MGFEDFVEEEVRFLVDKYLFDRNLIKEFKSNEQLLDDLLMFIRAYRRVSFIDLTDRYGVGDTAYGHYDKNIILWDRLKPDVAKSIDLLLSQEKIRLAYCPEKYGKNDGLKTFPIAEDPQKRHEQLSWLPAALKPAD